MPIATAAALGISPIELRLYQSRTQAICDEMGVVLRRAAFSPNIKDRLDFSCALFDSAGRLSAQAAHIPVHLGSMAFAMADIIERFDWRVGDVVVFNDPFLGGTHLPDVTVVAPAFAAEQLIGFVANRAHHANIGANEPGSMPLSRTLDEEGIVIAPQLLLRDGVVQSAAAALLERVAGIQLPPQALLQHVALGDFRAQVSANEIGLARLHKLVATMGVHEFISSSVALDAYGARLAEQALARLPRGRCAFTDYLDDDGQGTQDLPICVRIDIDAERLIVDFTGTAPQVPGNVNCPLAVTAAAVFYVFRCLLPAQTPACAGTFALIELRAPLGCLVNACSPAAVAAGNVETSMRIVDAMLGALQQVLPKQIPAASQGSMNNIAMGVADAAMRWDYYETVAGGHGASATKHGLSARHSHMTNTLNTPVESLEAHYPLRVRRYALRRDSGGNGEWRGGDGVEREFEFLAPTRVTLLSERRTHAPWGIAGGADGAKGENRLNDALLPGKFAFTASPGDRLLIRTPGGGGYGPPSAMSKPFAVTLPGK